MASNRPPRRATAPNLDMLRDRHNRGDEAAAIIAEETMDSNSEESDNVESINSSDSDSDHEVGNDNNNIPNGNYIGRNGFEWNLVAPDNRGRRGRHDIIREREGPSILGRGAVDILDTFHLFVSDEILLAIVRYTNDYAALYNTQNPGWTGERWTNIDIIELKAFIACLLFCGLSKSRHESYDQLWSTDIGRPFLRACLSLSRFTIICKFLRFDDRATREDRRMRDKLAAIRDIWEIFVQRCRSCYIPGSNCTIDEQLVGFRGHCPFRVYMSSKPDKYGIKVWWLCDSATGYAFNGQVYLGRVGNLPEVGLAGRVVHDLCRPLYNTGRNITMDNFFSSVPLAETLLNENLTVLGTLRANKAQIPPQFQKDNRRELHSSLFGFTRNTSLCSYVPKKGKAVIMLSTSHHDSQLSDRDDRKPTIIMDYNSTKGAVDTLDQCTHQYSCSRGTLRWPNKLLYNIIDVGAFNGYIIFTKNNPEWNLGKLFKRRLYLLDLVKLLAAQQMDRRAQNPRLPIPLRNILAEQGFNNRGAPLNAAAAGNDANVDRSRCYMCHQRKQVRIRCNSCQLFVCKEHSTKTTVCLSCNV